ncbi:MAG: putative toxin-antitoxin system toxin component, PIN family [Cytophagia bacterium]|nr:MAG: putative toxin-antitoxin system toxin component, PIN family [Runella sp.]TAG25255.1 MAG: putative toxin-antitoxin system toxin component, PIN family [Cytophagales bacterium]TAG42461.1 MAG: putative toxin-antitoxin system toxin component, PIN family [Cytophagia bacterium]TAG56692.1 MAG: putative toxin-antitoxin system toxin component, PIN family [Runella slithyformis]TAG84652.1 MAG: putative toxin-antitoxin system toxin component, PIN family [Cytophagales bacterium]
MKQRIILDTNCLLVCVPKQSSFRWIYDKILTGDVELAVSTEILLEYEAQLAKFYSAEYAEMILKVLINLPNIIKINPISFNWLLIEQDPDDDKFVDVYVASNADIIITNDRHYHALKKIKFPSIHFCKLSDYEPYK